MRPADKEAFMRKYLDTVTAILVLASIVAFLKYDAALAEHEYAAAENAAYANLVASKGHQLSDSAEEDNLDPYRAPMSAPDISPTDSGISECDEACKEAIAKINNRLMEIVDVRLKARNEAMFKRNHDIYVAPVEAAWNYARRIWNHSEIAGD
jgi:hypothetical protein